SLCAQPGVACAPAWRVGGWEPGGARWRLAGRRAAGLLFEADAFAVAGGVVVGDVALDTVEVVLELADFVRGEAVHVVVHEAGLVGGDGEAEGPACVREAGVADTAVGGVGDALHEAVLLQAVYEVGDVG